MKISNKTRFENIFFQILDKTNLNVIKQFKTFIYYVYYTTGAHLFAQYLNRTDQKMATPVRNFEVCAFRLKY